MAQLTEEEIKQSQQAQLLEDGERLQRLKENEDFKWFYVNGILQGLDQMKIDILNTDTTTEEGQFAAAVKIAALKQTSGVIGGLFNFYENVVNDLAN